MKILEQEVNNPDALSALYDLHYGSRAYDKAWCLAATMNFLLRDRVRGCDDARAFYEQYKPKRPIAPQARLDEERWIKDLFHPNEDPFVGKIFASILPSLRRVKVQPVARFGLTDKERQDPATSSVALVRAMGLAGAGMNLPQMPLIYLRPTQPGGLSYVPSEPWSSIAGSGLLQGLSPQELQFVASKHMAYYRMEHYVRVLFPTVAELTPLLLAAIKIVKPDFGSAGRDSGNRRDAATAGLSRSGELRGIAEGRSLIHGSGRSGEHQEMVPVRGTHRLQSGVLALG